MQRIGIARLPREDFTVERLCFRQAAGLMVFEGELKRLAALQTSSPRGQRAP